MNDENKIVIEKHVTDILLFDIVGYSLLSDDDQYRAIFLLNKWIEQNLKIIFGQSFLNFQEVILGLVPTGDGMFLLLRHELAGYGILLTVSLRSMLLLLLKKAPELFPGVRFAVHTGLAMPIKDITGNTNFLGSGFNDCSRVASYRPSPEQCLAIGCTDENMVMASVEAVHWFQERYHGPKNDEFFKTISFRLGEPFSFEDKHGKLHEAHLIESNRHVAITPPKPPDLERRFEEIRENISKGEGEVRGSGRSPPDSFCSKLWYVLGLIWKRLYGLLPGSEQPKK